MPRIALLAFFALGASAFAGPPPLAPEALSAAARYSAGRGGSALLVRQAGRTVLAAGQTGEAHKIYSGTKAFWILAALRAVQEGILQLEEKASETLPEWRADPRKSGITIAQLLNFTSGLDPQFQLHASTIPDRNRVALAAPLVANPGAAFIYGPASLQVFEELFRRKLATRGETPTRYLERKVLRPLGLGAQRYLSDGAGQPLLATGFRLTAEEWARLGQLVLDKGKPVVSASLLERCFRGTSANPAFGMAFWNNRTLAREADVEDLLDRKWPQQDWSGVGLSRVAPRDLVASIGSGYQRLYVIPSRELVIVRFGNFTRFPEGEFFRLLFSEGMVARR